MRAPFGGANIMHHFDSSDLAWCEIDGTLVFLNIANDRYFQLADADNRMMLDRIERSALGRSHQPSWLPKPSALSSALRTSAAIESGPFSLAEVARAMWVQRRVERRLAARGFASMLTYLSQSLDSRSPVLTGSDEAACRTIAAFEHSRLIRTAADRCLPRSIALALCLAARGVRAHVVIGVAIAPFAAHCWVQAGDEILNESVAEVLRYQPILVI